VCAQGRRFEYAVLKLFGLKRRQPANMNAVRLRSYALEPFTPTGLPSIPATFLETSSPIETYNACFHSFHTLFKLTSGTCWTVFHFLLYPIKILCFIPQYLWSGLLQIVCTILRGNPTWFWVRSRVCAWEYFDASKTFKSHRSNPTEAYPRCLYVINTL
jgi:hypothetical protein